MHVRHMYGINELFNFETFGRSFTLLFQMCTSAGWDSVLAGITNEDKCDSTASAERPNGDCGNRGMGIAYLVTYLLISFLVVVNMYIAVILENFSQATEDVQQGLTQDDFDTYYEVWEKFDDKATQFIPLDMLSDFVDALEEPLRIAKPNYYKLVALDIPICEGNKLYCVDILDALTRNFLQTSDAAELSDLKKRPANIVYVQVSSTLKRQREIICARIIQRRWKNFVLQRKALKMGNSELAPKAKNHIILRIDEVDEENEMAGKEKSNSSLNQQQQHQQHQQQHNQIENYDINRDLGKASTDVHCVIDDDVARPYITNCHHDIANQPISDQPIVDVPISDTNR